MDSKDDKETMEETGAAVYDLPKTQGAEVENLNFRPFTCESLQKIKQAQREMKVKLEKAKRKGAKGLEDLQEEEELKQKEEDLYEGKLLPSRLGRFSDKLLGRPIEELDSSVAEHEQSFCVIAKRFGKKYINRFSSTNALFLLSPLHPLRKFMVLISTHNIFDILIILTILVNCVFLAMNETPENAQLLATAEWVFTAIYTTEAFIKIISRGFILEKFTYLRDAWNWLDFSVIVLAWVTGFVSLGSFSGLRTFRVLRALKTISVIPGLKAIINALMNSTRMLAEVMFLTVFVLCIFALFSLQVYVGVLRTKCVLNFNFTAVNDTVVDTLWFSYVQKTFDNDSIFSDIPEQDIWYINPEEPDYPLLCSNLTSSGPNYFGPWSPCPENYTCLKDIGDNPNFGYTNFDNFGWALITSFQLITLDYWENVYNLIIRSQGAFNILFFLVIVLFGSFYLINLMLAVVAMSYDMEADKKDDADETSTVAATSMAVLGVDPSSKSGKKKKKKKKKKRKRKVEDSTAVVAAITGRSDLKDVVNSGDDDSKLGDKESRTDDKDSGTGDKYSSTGDKDSHTGVEQEKGSKAEITIKVPSEMSKQGHDNLGLDDDDSNLYEEFSYYSDDETCSEAFSVIDMNGSTKKLANGHHPNGGNIYLEPIGRHKKGAKDEEKREEEVDIQCCPYKKCCSCCRECCICPIADYKRWKVFQDIVALIILDPLIDVFITLCIVINTLFLAMDHHGMDATLSTALSIGNLVFTGIFTTECVMKITALGGNYFRNGWNNFDFFIVLMSLVELPLEGVSGLSVLRSFRLMRVLKLAQSWPTMRMLVAIMGNTVGAIANLSLILMLVIFIFAVIGMQLFSASYTADKFGGEVPRWNFTDFPHSFMMVFRVLCGEWIEPLYDCMRANPGSEGGCIAVFIATLMVGNFMVLNLFLALLLNSFQTDKLKKQDAEKNEEDRLKLGVQKLIRIFKCQYCRKSNKVGDSEPEENGNEKKKEEDKENHTLSTVENGFVKHEDSFKNNEGDNEEEGEEEEPEVKHFARVELFGSKVKIRSRTGSPVKSRPTSGVSRVMSTASLRSAVLNKFENAHQQESKDNHTLHTNGFLKPNGSLQASPVSSRNGSAIFVSTKDKPDRSAFQTEKEREAFSSFSNALESNKNQSSDVGEGDDEVLTTQVEKFKLEDEVENQEKEMEANAEAEPPADPLRDCCPTIINHSWNRNCKPKCLCCLPEDFDGSTVGKSWHTLRGALLKVVENKIFEGIILFLIGVSSITLVFEDTYLKEGSIMFWVLYYLNIIFAALFTVEMLLKWVAHGYVRYFTSFWSCLDFIIVLISLLDLLAGAIGLNNLSAFRALRTLRALRPLRAISRWQGMRIVVNALAHAIPSFVNILVVCLVFWLIFSIMGVQFFKGQFFKCLDDEGERLTIDIVNNKSDCLSMNYTWKNSKVTFDNVIIGYLALFQVATFEGWMEVMEDAIDSRGIDMQPSRENSFGYYFYFVGFIMFGTFFTLNLFIGVIIDNFNVLKKKYEGDSTLDMFLTNNQRNYYQTMRRLGTKKPTKQLERPQANYIRNFFFDMTNSTKFEIIIVSLILFNMVAMCLEHYQQPEELTEALNYLNYIFTAFFVLECIFKLIGMGWHYFKKPWNVFDFIIVIASLMGIILQDLLASLAVNPTLLRVVRVFRIGRVLRLVKAAKGIRKLLFALVISLPALLNIGALLFLIVFIYSIFGMNFFGGVTKSGRLNDVVNFDTWVNSFLVLFRMSTAAGWNDVLDPLMATEANGECHQVVVEATNTTAAVYDGICPTPIVSQLFFFSFIFVTFLIIINMYIAVILENFSQAHQQEEVGITEDDFDMFYQIWEKYDPKATQFMQFERLTDFCDELEPPLRLAKPNRIKITGLDLALYEGDNVHCLDMLRALTMRVLGEVEESGEDFATLQEEMAQRFIDNFPDLDENRPVETTLGRKKKESAASKIQKAYRLYRMMKEINKAASTARSQHSHTDSDEPQSHRNSSVHLNADHSNLNTSFGSYGNALTVKPEKYGQNLSVSALPDTTIDGDGNSAAENPSLIV